MLRLRLFKYRLEIHATVLLLALFVLDSGLPGAGVVAWVAAALLSIIIHELGHAVTVDMVGGEVEAITLYALGGLTSWRGPSRGWRRFVVAAAGSLSSIALALVLFALVKQNVFGEFADFVIETPWTVYLGNAVAAGDWAVFFLATFIWVSVVWGAINLLPIGGLDGSTMLAQVIDKVIPGRGDFHAATIGMAVAIGAGILLYQRGYTFAPIIFLVFAGSRLLQVLRQPPPPRPPG
ncbi:MAG: M50 family metallopeptidase [Acidimicrobiia bacterium]|nr:M50 family metallopeptidase [Acidimicrobiia bacterium]